VVFWIHTNFFDAPNLYEAKFTLYNTISPDGKHISVLFDTAIFDGLVTPRIHKGIWSLMGKRALPRDDPIVSKRPSFAGEIHDICSLLNEKNRDRAESFRAVKSYFMYSSAFAPRKAYIEWTTRVLEAPPISENAADNP
jgi:hypothetical protein